MINCKYCNKQTKNKHFCNIKCRDLYKKKFNINPSIKFLTWRIGKKGNIGNQNNFDTIKKISETKKKLYKEGKIKSWNIGLTKEIDNRIRKQGEKRKLNTKFIKIKCKYCGIEKEYQECLDKNRKYCSNECNYKDKIGVPTWSNGLTKENDNRVLNQSNTLKKWHKKNPEHGIKLSCAGRLKQSNMIVSKPQMELYLLIKQKYPEAELEYPIKTKHSIRFADVAIPSLKLDIEYDGMFWHTHPELDKLRDKQLAEVGWKTIRFNKDNIQIQLNGVINL